MKILSLGKVTITSTLDGKHYLLCNGTCLDFEGAGTEEAGIWLINFLDPTQQFPQPVWAWWLLRGDGITDDTRALQEKMNQANKSKD